MICLAHSINNTAIVSLKKNQRSPPITSIGNLQWASAIRFGVVAYNWSDACWIYLATVFDLNQRHIVGLACSDSPGSELTTKALQMAYASRGHPQGVMFHSDQGCHYTSRRFRQILWRYQIKQSMSPRGNCWESLPHEVLWV